MPAELLHSALRLRRYPHRLNVILRRAACRRHCRRTLRCRLVRCRNRRRGKQTLRTVQLLCAEHPRLASLRDGALQPRHFLDRGCPLLICTQQAPCRCRGCRCRGVGARCGRRGGRTGGDAECSIRPLWRWRWRQRLVQTELARGRCRTPADGGRSGRVRWGRVWRDVRRQVA